MDVGKARDAIDTFQLAQRDKRLVENSGVNVLYFTNKCNLACTYCYEDLKGRETQKLSKEQIRNSVDIILEREDPNEQTLFVMFGGEVTLEWENAVYCMEYAYSKKKNVHFNISTNGIKFLEDDFLASYKTLKFNMLGLTSLDISFDGVGNQERVTHSGKQSTPMMLEVFKRLNNNKIKWRLRYTIHKLNCGSMYEDISRIAKYIHPDRIITSVAWSQLDETDINNIEMSKQKLRHDWLQGDITVPVCELFCDVCSGCEVQKDLKTYFTDEGNVNTYKNSDRTIKFKDFKEKE